MRKSNLFALLAAASAILVSSCAKENAPVAVEDGVTAPTTFVGYVDDSETKTTLNEGTMVYWKEGDEISVNGSIYVASPDADNPKRAIFTLKSGQRAPTGTSFRAYYPSSAWTSNSYTQRFKLPTTQTFNGNDISAVNPMFATATELDGGTFVFKNVCGLLAFDLKGEEAVKSIKLTANTTVSGTISNLTLSNDNLTYSSWVNSGRSSTVTLNCATAVQLHPEIATTFYMAVPYATYSSFKIEITCASGKVKTINSTKAPTVERGHIYHVPATVSFPVLDFNAVLSVDKNVVTSASTVDVEVSVIPEDKDVTYVVALEAKEYVDDFNSPLELAQGDIDFWKDQGATSVSQLVDAGIAFKGDLKNYAGFANYVRPNTDMVLYAYAIDNDFNVSPAISLPVHFDAYSYPAIDAKYEDYLGDWNIGAETISVTEKVKGSSYNVSGIKNQSDLNIASVEAAFDNGYFILNEQKTSATTTVGTYGTCDLYLSGVFASGTKTYGYYPLNGDTPCEIFRGAYDAASESVTVMKGSCTYGTFTTMGFSWVIQSGVNAGKGNTYGGTKLTDMTHPATIPQELLGVYVCPSALDYSEQTPVEYTNWALTVYENNGSLFLRNLDPAFNALVAAQGIATDDAAARWNPANNTLTILDGTATGLGSSSASALWSGLTETSTCDIVFAVDLANHTLTLQTDFGAIMSNVMYSEYHAPLTFTYQGAATASTSAPKKAFNAEISDFTAVSRSTRMAVSFE